MYYFEITEMKLNYCRKKAEVSYLSELLLSNLIIQLIFFLSYRESIYSNKLAETWANDFIGQPASRNVRFTLSIKYIDDVSRN